MAKYLWGEEVVSEGGVNEGVRGRQFLTAGASHPLYVYLCILFDPCLCRIDVGVYVRVYGVARKTGKGGGGLLECAGVCAVREGLPAGALVCMCVCGGMYEYVSERMLQRVPPLSLHPRTLP